MERETGFEPATPTLARWCSTTELLSQFKWLAQLDSNQRMTESKSAALPLGYGPIKIEIMGRPMGIEPTSAGATIRCVNPFATAAIMAGVVGIEPTSKVLETFVLPLNYTPIYGGGSRTRTYEPDGSGFTVRRVWPTSLSLHIVENCCTFHYLRFSTRSLFDVVGKHSMVYFAALLSFLIKEGYSM